MSNVYNLEPPTKGKVVLKTTLGDLDIELWGKECPKAVRNFVQLCMEGYYDNTIFHRMMKGYLVQGGDPTGTGQGGESIYGEMFKDEFHSRLRFTHRGLVACANQNEPHTNASQFFITLDKTEWLDKKNTIFGRISGDSIYNLLRMEELEVDGDDRPLEPPMILEAEILWNPFEDIMPRRDMKAEREAAAAKRAAEEAAQQKASRPKAKNLSLLSFGEEAGEEEEELAAVAVASKGAKIRSAHDVLADARLARPEDTPDDEIMMMSERIAAAKMKAAEQKLKAADRGDIEKRKGRARDEEESEEEEEGEGRGKRSAWGDASASGKDFATAMLDQAKQRRRAMGDGSRPSGRPQEQEQGPSSSHDGGEENEEDKEDQATVLEKRNEKYLNKGPHSGRVRAADDVADADLLKPWQLSREKYKQQKRMLGDREKDTMARLAKFTASLKGASTGKAAAESSRTAEGEHEGDKEGSTALAALFRDDGKADDAGYSGKVRQDIDHRSYLPAAWRVDDYLDRDDLDTSLEDLRNHKLKFSNPSGRTDNMERADNLDDYVVYDPLLEKGKGKFSKAENDKKKRKTEWAGRPNL